MTHQYCIRKYLKVGSYPPPPLEQPSPLGRQDFKYVHPLSTLNKFLKKAPRYLLTHSTPSSELLAIVVTTTSHIRTTSLSSSRAIQPLKTEDAST